MEDTVAQCPLYPQKRTLHCTAANVRYVPKADIAPSFIFSETGEATVLARREAGCLLFDVTAAQSDF